MTKIVDVEFEICNYGGEVVNMRQTSSWVLWSNSCSLLIVHHVIELVLLAHNFSRASSWDFPTLPSSVRPSERFPHHLWVCVCWWERDWEKRWDIQIKKMSLKGVKHIFFICLLYMVDFQHLRLSWCRLRSVETLTACSLWFRVPFRPCTFPFIKIYIDMIHNVIWCFLLQLFVSVSFLHVCLHRCSDSTLSFFLWAFKHFLGLCT